MREKCLFCPTEAYLYGQLEEKSALRTVENLNRNNTGTPWRIDRSPWQYTTLPKLDKNYGGTVYNNPCELFLEHNHVWVTRAPEGSECEVDRDTMEVIINRNAFNLYKNYII